MNTPPLLQPYPTYKPSGVEWLGDVPAHWDVRRLKHWVGINQRTLSETTDQSFEFRYIEIGAVSSGKLTEQPARIRFADAPSRARRVLRTGDTIISTVRTYLKAVWFADDVADDLVCSTGFAVLTPRPGTVPKFVSYLAQSDFLTGCITLESVGIAYPAIAESVSGTLQVPVPPLEEQAAIVRYLDDAAGRLDRCRGAKARLIALLDEYRQAAIYQAVTRGFNPDVPLKPTGDPWLGDAPAHWAVRRLKRLGRLSGGSGFPVHEQGRQDMELPFFKVSDMNLPGNEMEMTVWNNSVSHETATKLRANVFPPGTIIFPKVGGALLTNKRRVLQRPACIDNNLMGYTIQNGNPAFMLWLLQHIDLATIAQPGPLPAVNEHEVGEVRVALPPPEEQAAIADHLDRVTADIDATIAHARREIELLDEYRASLIAAVVTGQLDVRAADDIMDTPTV